ncbi:MAG: tetratricopeptide repeat protein [Chloroflexi bacterium]|nr:tetratricopeptide repeat protein [Chloroflexota bacterium]
MTQSTPPPSTPLFRTHLIETLINVLMALVVIQIAVITFWFTLAEDSNGDAGRDAQLFALQSLGKRTVGSLRTGYDQTGAYNHWLELNTLARVAAQRGDEAAAERLRAARDRVAKLSPVLQPPYMGDAVVEPDLAKYAAENFVQPATALTERFENQYRQKVQWSDKASAYTVQLTLLAVALFMFGVAASSKRFVRVMFFGIGLALALVVLVWMLWVYFQPVSALPDEAIDAYARGEGALYQGEAVAAIKQYDQALQLAPTYTSAYRDRGYAKYVTGDYTGAASDLENARANGDASSDTQSSLGYLYYLLGQFDKAHALNRQAAQQAPNEFWVRANYALGLLAAGKIGEAQNEYDAALSQMAQLVAAVRAQAKEPPAALWYDFDGAVSDLDTLQQCAATQACDGAPPFASLQNAPAIAITATTLATKLKEHAVALEYTSKPPAGTVTATVEPFAFTRVLSDDDAEVQDTETFAATDEPIYVITTFSGLQDGQQLVIKVYVDGSEDDRLRVADTYSVEEMGGADGDIFLPITTGGVPLTPGAYRIEMYVNSKLVQRGEFSVVAENE